MRHLTGRRARDPPPAALLRPSSTGRPRGRPPPTCAHHAARGAPGTPPPTPPGTPLPPATARPPAPRAATPALGRPCPDRWRAIPPTSPPSRPLCAPALSYRCPSHDALSSISTPSIPTFTSLTLTRLLSPRGVPIAHLLPIPPRAGEVMRRLRGRTVASSSSSSSGTAAAAATAGVAGPAAMAALVVMTALVVLLAAALAAPAAAQPRPGRPGTRPYLSRANPVAVPPSSAASPRIINGQPVSEADEAFGARLCVFNGRRGKGEAREARLRGAKADGWWGCGNGAGEGGRVGGRRGQESGGREEGVAGWSAPGWGLRGGSPEPAQ